MPSKSPRKPSYLRHKATGQARVRIAGKDIYLGLYDSPESRERYDEEISAWLANSRDPRQVRYTITLDELALLFMRHAEGYYRRADGEPTGEIACLRAALRPLVKLFGTARARDFSPRRLKDVRQAMVDAGNCRTSINRQVHRLKRVFRWAVENEYLPIEVYSTLTTVASLKRGRSPVRESAPVVPVEQSIVDASLPHLSPTVAAMVRLQLLTGARPGEICAIRPGDITFGTNGVWTYRPSIHKTTHHGKERRIFIGPEGQEILRPFLDRDSEAFCFSPRESEAKRRAENHRRRKTPLMAGNRPRVNTGNRFKDRYSKDAYGRSIARACEAAFQIPKELQKIGPNLPEAKRRELRKLAAEWRAKHVWSPNRLRHSRATLLRDDQSVCVDSYPPFFPPFGERLVAMRLLGEAIIGSVELLSRNSI